MTRESRLSDMVGWGEKDTSWGYHGGEHCSGFLHTDSRIWSEVNIPDVGAILAEGEGKYYAESAIYSTEDTVGQ